MKNQSIGNGWKKEGLGDKQHFRARNHKKSLYLVGRQHQNLNLRWWHGVWPLQFESSTFKNDYIRKNMYQQLTSRLSISFNEMQQVPAGAPKKIYKRFASFDFANCEDLAVIQCQNLGQQDQFSTSLRT